MFTCSLCKHATPLDDVIVGPRLGRCVCLRCFSHAVGDARRVHPALRRVIDTLP
jgi:hypothetical protein